jgi:regulator of cell morphogenesis and NO signaling
MRLDHEQTVGEWVAAHPDLARVFERLKIDYCCGGKLTLAEACAQRGLDLEEVLRELGQESGTPGPTRVDAAAMGLEELVDHIESTHHAYLKRELPRLETLTEKVAAAHGQRDPRLVSLRKTFLDFQAELTSHMLKEERVLFPMIRLLARSDQPVTLHCGSLANPIRVMESEHDQAGAALARFREWTDDFTPPAWACGTLHALYHALAELEADMHQHVHKENNVLFPKALAREAELAGTAQPR